MAHPNAGPYAFRTEPTADGKNDTIGLPDIRDVAEDMFISSLVQRIGLKIGADIDIFTEGRQADIVGVASVNQRASGGVRPAKSLEIICMNFRQDEDICLNVTCRLSDRHAARASSHGAAHVVSGLERQHLRHGGHILHPRDRRCP